MANSDFSLLERRIEDLLDLCETLKQENRVLKARQRAWASERAELIEKNELARTQVDAMIQRLKSLEQDA